MPLVIVSKWIMLHLYTGLQPTPQRALEGLVSQNQHSHWQWVWVYLKLFSVGVCQAVCSVRDTQPSVCFRASEGQIQISGFNARLFGVLQREVVSHEPAGERRQLQNRWEHCLRAAGVSTVSAPLHWVTLQGDDYWVHPQLFDCNVRQSLKICERQSETCSIITSWTCQHI